MPKFAYKIVIQRALLALTLLSLLSLVPQSNVSAAYAQQTQLLPSDPAAANQMGYAVEASGFYGGLMTVMGVSKSFIQILVNSMMFLLSKR